MIEFKSCLLGVMTLGLCASGAGAADGQMKISALKQGDRVFVRSFFSADKDVVIAVGKGMNGQINFQSGALLPSGESDFTKGAVFHSCGDDSVPWNLNGTYIGGNHGCSDGRVVTVKNHGLTDADTGAELTDGDGNKFYIIKIAGPDNFWILSENKSNDEIWRFNTKVNGPDLKYAAKDKTLTFSDCKMVQITPACRIKSQKYLVNGSDPLQDGKPVSCDYLDIAEDYDIICPDSLLKLIRSKPGVAHSFTDPSLDSVVTNRIVYRFLPMGACGVEHKSTANRKFKLGYMGFIQSAQLTKGSYGSHLYYIPGTLPFERGGVKFDFASIQDYSSKPPVPLNFNTGEKNVESQAALPARFIQFLGVSESGQNVNKIGYALGYSLTEGITQPEERAKGTRNALMLYTSAKTYPHAIDSKLGEIPAGKEFHCAGYRQYFDPSAYKNATCVYHHKEGASTVVYIDYHKSVENDKLALPSQLAGKKITVVEKTPSLTLHTDKTVPADGLLVSVKDRGRAILKLD